MQQVSDEIPDLAVDSSPKLTNDLPILPERPLSPIFSSAKVRQRLRHSRVRNRSQLPEKLSVDNDKSSKLQLEDNLSARLAEQCEEPKNSDVCWNFPEAVKEPQSLQTAAGERIVVSEKALLNHSRVFDDILYGNTSGRCNKYSFLSKNNGAETSEIQENVCKAPAFSGLSTAVSKLSEEAGSVPQKIFNESENNCLKLNKETLNPPQESYDEESSKHQVENKIEFETTSKNIPAFPSFGSGFSRASGKAIKISEEALKKSTCIFDLSLTNLPIESLETKRPSISKSEIPTPVNQNFLNILPTSGGGFSRASGKAIQISEEALKKSTCIFDLSPTNLPMEPLETKRHLILKPEISTPVNQKFLSFLPTSGSGFSTANGKSIKMSENTMKKAACLLEDTPKSLTENIPQTPLKSTQSCSGSVKRLPTSSSGFATANGKAIKMSEDTMKKAACLLEDTPKSVKENIPQTPLKSTQSCSGSVKRRLGVAACKQLEISEVQLKRSRLMFEEKCQKPPQTPTPTKTRQQFSSGFNFTPKATSVINKQEAPVIRTFTPKAPAVLVQDSGNFRKEPPGTYESLLQKLNKEKQSLLERLHVVESRVHAVENGLAQNEHNHHETPICGVLTQRKQQRDRISLQKFVGTERRSPCGKYINVTPQTAEKFCFVHNKLLPYETTQDGALVIPNTDELIGVMEIEWAFKRMPGVVAKLLPKNWVLNHYKWIIWKLASYERNLNAPSSLSVENVVQQLKYRYDREIDRAERSALRRICEKDDAAQKRMVLCVSNITQVANNHYELQLTDGWYAIKTLIDDALCFQIAKDRLRIGTKLVTCNAELLNCDEGCHPLEMSELVALKIHYNCTRRAVWYAKLGYQRPAGPLLVPIDTVHPLGGTIGAVKFFVARVYPVKYMEQENHKKVWRNKRAEDHRAQQWENERDKKLEAIGDETRKDLEKNLNKNQNCVSSIQPTPPNGTHVKTLYEIMNTCNDPESFQASLSSDQQQELHLYMETLTRTKQNKFEVKLQKKVGQLNRNVVSLLEVVVVDCSSLPKPNQCYNSLKKRYLNVWNPTNVHMECLREGEIVTAYTVFPNKNNGLSTNSKTKFKLEVKPCEDLLPNFSRYEPQLLSIALLREMQGNCIEFDTVGVVLQMKISEQSQLLWLAHFSGSLMLMRVGAGPEHCLLLSGLTVGQVISVCNLEFKGMCGDFAEASGGLRTVISRYPRFKRLQEAMKVFTDQLPKNMAQFLDECDNKISIFDCFVTREW